jgi:dihydroflavonol-4-reductase
MSKTIAVTGASGHLGNVLCRMLIESGFRVRAFYHTSQKSLQDLPLELIHGDVLNKDDLDRLITGCEIVINSAAIISIHGDPKGIVFKTNTQGPANVLEVSKRKGVRKLIHISSVHAVLEIPLTLPYDETRPYKKSSPPAYDYSKAIGEQIILNGAKEASLEVVVLRPSCIIGPFDCKPSEMGKALLDFYHQKIPVLPPGGYDFVDVRDVTRSIVSSIEKGLNGEIYLLSGKYYTLRELAQVIHRVTGKRVPKIALPFWLLQLAVPFHSVYCRLTGANPQITKESVIALRNGHPHMNSSKAIHQLGHSCRSIEESLHDFYEWQQKAGIISNQ